MAERNPSPPRLSVEETELIQYDNIGDTVFSKKWVLSTLMKLLQIFQNHGEDGVEEEDEDDQESEALNDNFDGELCELWDMSMNEDVVVFLQEVNAAEVLRDVILKSHDPRITEVSVGILANMACNQEVCTKIGKSAELINILTALLDDTDPPILVEVTRLVNACVSNEETRQEWIQALDSCSAFKHFIYILENSLNVDLLNNTSQLVDNILDFSDEILKKWADLSLVNAVCEALKQMRSEQLKIADVLLHVLQLLSTVESGVRGLVSCLSVVPLLCHFIAECGHDEGGIIVGRESSLTSCFSVLNVILVADPLTVLTAMEKDPCIIKILLGLLGYSCKLHRKRSRNSLSFTEKGKEKDLKTSGGDEEAKNEEKEPEDKRCQTPSLGGREGSSTTTSTSETKDTDGNGDVKCNLSVGVDKTGDDDIQNNYNGSNSTQTAVKRSPSHDAPGASPNVASVFRQESITEDSVHHHYFTGAVTFLKDIISQSVKSPGCVSKMLAPHETILEKIVHYSSRIKPYQQMVIDLVESSSAAEELSSLSDRLTQAAHWPEETS